MIYLYIPSPEFSESRVQHRVKQGGHAIPTAEIFRRYPRSLKNLFDYMNVCDETYCMDNSGALPVPVFEKMKSFPEDVENPTIYKKIKEYCRHE